MGNNRKSVSIGLKYNLDESFFIFVGHTIDSDLYIEKEIDS